MNLNLVRTNRTLNEFDVARLVERGARLLELQTSTCKVKGCGRCKSEVVMRRQLAAETGIAVENLVCVGIAAGIRYEARQRHEELGPRGLAA